MDWRNEETILQDLAIVQGAVPQGSVETVPCDHKPPTLHIEEETEEEFITQYVAEGNSGVAPDLGLIKDMLDMVRDVTVKDIDNSDKEEESENVEKSKEIKTSSPLSPTKVHSKQKNKNAAMESILNMSQKKGKTQPLLLIKPENMFKAKSNTSVESNKNNAKNNVSNNGTTVYKPKTKEYVPTSQAQEYCNKLLEAQRQRELREDTIWTRAERQMREIEERKRNQTSASATVLN